MPIIYVTSVSQKYPRIVRAARALVREKGSGQARMLTMPAHMLPRDQAEWAQRRMVGAPEWDGPRWLVVASTYELPVLRAMRALRERFEDTPDAFVISSKFAVHVLTADDVYRLRVEQRGEFLDPWPEGFFDERTHELF